MPDESSKLFERVAKALGAEAEARSVRGSKADGAAPRLTLVAREGEPVVVRGPAGEKTGKPVSEGALDSVLALLDIDSASATAVHSTASGAGANWFGRQRLLVVTSQAVSTHAHGLLADAPGALAGAVTDAKAALIFTTTGASAAVVAVAVAQHAAEQGHTVACIADTPAATANEWGFHVDTGRIAETFRAVVPLTPKVACVGPADGETLRVATTVARAAGTASFAVVPVTTAAPEKAPRRREDEPGLWIQHAVKLALIHLHGATPERTRTECATLLAEAFPLVATVRLADEGTVSWGEVWHAAATGTDEILLTRAAPRAELAPIVQPAQAPAANAVVIPSAVAPDAEVAAPRPPAPQQPVELPPHDPATPPLSELIEDSLVHGRPAALAVSASPQPEASEPPAPPITALPIAAPPRPPGPAKPRFSGLLAEAQSSMAGIAPQAIAVEPAPARPSAAQPAATLTRGEPRIPGAAPKPEAPPAAPRGSKFSSLLAEAAEPFQPVPVAPPVAPGTQAGSTPPRGPKD